MVFATVLVADAIVFEASLSFIGTGITSVNTPTWGNMLSEGKALLLSGHWWQTFFPGLFILITTLSLNILSEGLTDSLASPKIKTRVNVQADEEAEKGAAAGIANSYATQTASLNERLTALEIAELARTDRLVVPHPDAEPILDVRNLSISFPSAHGDVKIVDNVSFTVRPGETMGLVGESGCGKSITAMAIMGLLPPTAKFEGEIIFEGRDLLKLDDKERNALRGHEIEHGLPGRAQLAEPVDADPRPDEAAHQARRPPHRRGAARAGRARPRSARSSRTRTSCPAASGSAC